MQNDTWKYDGINNTLTQISTKDLRNLFSVNLPAPLVLLFVGDNTPEVLLHSGSSYQNVSLYCTSKGLANLVRTSFKGEQLKKELKLENEKNILASITVGWPKENSK